MRTLNADDRRRRIASAAYALIENEVRPFLAAGGRLWSKGSRGYPTRLRRMLEPLESRTPTFATRDAMLLAPRRRQVEHVLPLKRIIVEIVDPGQADPRANVSPAPIAGGPATSPEHLLEIFDRLFSTCWVTPEEHARLNRGSRSSQWDAPEGDGWERYRLAGVTAYPLTVDGTLLTP
jgi:hypothetical protein